MLTIKPFGTLPADALRLTLGDHHIEVADRLAHHFRNAPGVEVVQGNLLDLDADAFVSPANSFGDMSGGLDKAIDDFHHGEAQRRVMESIRLQFMGELPVGMAIMVGLDTPRFPWLIVAPTMRIPGDIRGTLNAYLAMRAVLVALVRHNALARTPLRSVVVPGLGTGVGGLNPDDAAQQMRAAHDNILGGNWQQVVHPSQAPFAWR